ncbi:beta-class phenol-soluble modulin [Staphylococcus haemolyticus]
MFLNRKKAQFQAGQNQDWAKLGTSIVGIVENGVGILGKLFGF